MSSAEQQDQNQPEEPLSLTAQLNQAQALLEDDGDTNNNNNNNNENDKVHPSIKAIKMLENLQEQIQSSSIFSKNESLDDVQTSSLSLLATEYHYAKAYLQLPLNVIPTSATTQSTTVQDKDNRPQQPPPQSISKIRRTHVLKAMELFHLFLERCSSLDGLLQDTVQEDYNQTQTLLEELQAAKSTTTTPSSSSNNNNNNHSHLLAMQAPSATTRDTKLKRHRQSQKLKQQTQHLNAILTRRQRLNVPQEEEMESYNHESLMRTLLISSLNLHCLDSLSEISNSVKEVEMLDMACKMEEERMGMDLYRGTSTGRHQQHPNGHGGVGGNGGGIRRPPSSQSGPLKLTQITKNNTTGQLQIHRQEIQSQVFRPSWNQPTMTLDELAQRETQDAIDRSERQAEAEAAQKRMPRRYDQLVQDGMEDDVDLVDASAALDRRWDDWKDENPRGSGNKMGDVGDRNF